jgi:hypothetical protein
LQDVSGTVFGDPNGLRRGQVIELDEPVALRYMHSGLVEPLDAADETPAEHRARMDRAHEAVVAYMEPAREAVRKEREQHRRELEASVKAEKETQRRGWY